MRSAAKPDRTKFPSTCERWAWQQRVVTMKAMESQWWRWRWRRLKTVLWRYDSR